MREWVQCQILTSNKNFSLVLIPSHATHTTAETPENRELDETCMLPAEVVRHNSINAHSSTENNHIVLDERYSNTNPEYVSEKENDKVSLWTIQRLPNEPLGLVLGIHESGIGSGKVKNISIDGILPGGAADRAWRPDTLKDIAAGGYEVIRINGACLNGENMSLAIQFLRDMPLQVSLHVKLIQKLENNINIQDTTTIDDATESNYSRKNINMVLERNFDKQEQLMKSFENTTTPLEDKSTLSSLQRDNVCQRRDSIDVLKFADLDCTVEAFPENIPNSVQANVHDQSNIASNIGRQCEYFQRHARQPGSCFTNYTFKRIGRTCKQ